MRIRNVAENVQQIAEQMRQEPTSAEETLWEALRGRQVADTKFRRQAPMGKFILDFYAPSCKLVIELDGSVHDNQVERDLERAQHLQAYGYHVLRFPNDAVLNNLPAVLKSIESTITTLQPETQPSNSGNSPN